MNKFEEKYPYFWLILGLILTLLSYGIFNTGIDSHFGLNSIHMARIDGMFEIVDARSESGYESVQSETRTTARPDPDYPRLSLPD